MKNRILITDDDPALTASYRALLAEANTLDVDFASSHQEAQVLISNHKYDAALFDIELSDSGPSGLDLLSELKGRQPDALVLMMSTKDDNGTVTRCRSLGAAGFASKNIAFLQNFRRRVESLIQNRTEAFAA